MIESTLRLRVLLAQRVVEDDLVALNQPLRVLLPMLQLLVPISLDSFQ